MTWRHPHAYDWHDGHTGHHLDDNHLLVKADVAKPHPHMDAPPKNDQAAGVGVSTYAKFAHPYGTVTQGAKPDLLHYQYHGKLPQIEDLVKKHGFNVYYAGGKYGKPDLANRNYNTKHLMVYDPTPASGGDFGEEEYTKGWRQIHELAHALTYPELNKIYGEGRRIGKLGTHRSLNEAMRAVHWEHLAAHKQRELSKQIGIHIPDHVFNKEYNTVMHDAIHRAVTGKFTEPSQEGFEPHGHALPLTHALDTLRDEAQAMGLTGMHSILTRKTEIELVKALPKGAMLKPPFDSPANRQAAAEHAVTTDQLLEQGTERGVQPTFNGHSDSNAWHETTQAKHANVRQDDQSKWYTDERDYHPEPVANWRRVNEPFAPTPGSGDLTADQKFWSHPNFTSGPDLPTGVAPADKKAWMESDARAKMLARSPVMKRSMAKSEQVISMTYRSENVADKLTPEEAFEINQVAAEYLRKRTIELAKNLKDWQERELSKAIVPPHKHNLGTTTSAGVEDIAPGKVNPPGKNDKLNHAKAEPDSNRSDKPQTHENHMCTNCGKSKTKVTEVPNGKEPAGWHCSSCLGKAEETPGENHPPEETSEPLNKELLCKKCGGKHDMEKACMTKSGMSAAGKAKDTEEVDQGYIRQRQESQKPHSFVASTKKPGYCSHCKNHVSHETHKQVAKEELAKEMLYDTKGKEVDSGINPDSTLPEDKESKEVKRPASGGKIVKKSLKDIHLNLKKSFPPNAKPAPKQQEQGYDLSRFPEELGGHYIGDGKGRCDECGIRDSADNPVYGPTLDNNGNADFDHMACYGCLNPPPKTYQKSQPPLEKSLKAKVAAATLGAAAAAGFGATNSANRTPPPTHTRTVGPNYSKPTPSALQPSEPVKKNATPPMAKPPSGKNMSTNVPMSKDVKEMVVHNTKPVKPPKGADYEAKKDGDKAVYTSKGAMDPQMKQHMLASAGGPSVAPAAPQVKMPTPEVHAQRASQFADHMPGAGVTGHQMGAAPKRPGIFGRLNKSEELRKDGMAPTKTLTPGMPKLKAPGASLAPATGVGSAAPTMPTGNMAPTAISGAKPNVPGYRTPKLPNQPPVLTQGMPKLKAPGSLQPGQAIGAAGRNGTVPAVGGSATATQPAGDATRGARPANAMANNITQTHAPAMPATKVTAPPAGAAKFGGPVPQMPKAPNSQAPTRPDTTPKK